MPVLNNCICRVYDSTIHIDQNSGKGMYLRRSCERGLKSRHDLISLSKQRMKIENKPSLRKHL